MLRYIAIAYDKGNIFTDFDNCKEFIIYTFAEKTVFTTSVMGILENSIAKTENTRLRFLLQNNVSVVICDKISPKTKETLESMKMQVFDNISGSVKDAFEAFRNDKLEHN